MSIPDAQRGTVAYLRARAGADPIETHISLVFRGPDTVWKLKKAVRLPFLDFTALAARQHFALRELALNGPAAPGLYRDVVAVVRAEDGSLGLAGPGDRGSGQVVDWVLRMARVPEDDFLDRVAAEGRLDQALLDRLADTVAAYHGALAPVPGVPIVERMRAITLGNRPSAEAAGLPAATIACWQRAALAALAAIAPWQEARARAGFVRRAHGDLHLGNLCLWHGAPVPFDALEFDEAMATIDLAYDLAFLLMDLDLRAGRPAANRVMNRYIARTDDAALVCGLPAFLSIRAFILAHVQAARGAPARSSAYLAAAAASLRPARPIVVAIGGLQGSGKSTLARALAPALGRAPGALVLRSDEIRKRQHGVAPEVALGADAYTDAANRAVFDALAARARVAAAAGQAVIADATFLDPATRTELARAARAAGVAFLGLWLTAPLAELAGRIAARRADASDATEAVLRQAAENDPGAGDWCMVDARSRDGALDAAREAVRARLGPC